MYDAMEDELRNNLIVVADAYIALGGAWAENTIAHRILRNEDFLKHMRKGDRGFNIRKYDDLMGWYSANWPDGADWPAGVPRPAIPSPLTVPSETAPTVSSDMSPSQVPHG